jgi:DNA-binding response OmpR family regulator
MDGQPRVLVCDSESQSLRALKVVRRAAGFDVQAKRTAEEALDRAALRTPAVVIVEMLLPRWHLHAILRRARLGSHRPILEFGGVHPWDTPRRAPIR